MSFGKGDKFVAEKFRTFICRQFATAPAANLAAITGQTLRAAERQLSGEVKPGADAISACIAAFGPYFIASCFNAPWAQEAAHLDRKRKLQIELDQLSGRS